MHVHLKPSLLLFKEINDISPTLHQYWKAFLQDFMNTPRVGRQGHFQSKQASNQPNSFVSFVIGVGWMGGAFHFQPLSKLKVFLLATRVDDRHPLFVGHTLALVSAVPGTKSSHPFLTAKIKVLNWFGVSFVWVLVTWLGPYKVKFHKWSFGGDLERVPTI